MLSRGVEATRVADHTGASYEEGLTRWLATRATPNPQPNGVKPPGALLGVGRLAFRPALELEATAVQ
jgi:hypothetical protein